jgi:hypothetical protein
MGESFIPKVLRKDSVGHCARVGGNALTIAAFWRPLVTSTKQACSGGKTLWEYVLGGPLRELALLFEIYRFQKIRE